MLEFRAYLNEGGRVLYTGDQAGQQYAGSGGVGTQLLRPQGEIACNPQPAGVDPRRCLALRGSGDNVNDVLQYWFGAYNGIYGDGVENGDTFDVLGINDPFTGLSWGLNGPQSCEEPAHHPVLPRDERDPAGRVQAVRAGRPRGMTSLEDRSRRIPATSTRTRRSPT